MNTHPAAELFPLMEGSDFDRLVESIRGGFDPLQPIILDIEGRILDGRNRWRACQQASVQPMTVVYEGDDPYGEAVRLNIVRRHLTPSQIAGVLVRSDRLQDAEAQAKSRQSEAGRDFGRGIEKLVAPAPEAISGKSTEIVAKEFGIGERTLRGAKRVEREAPDLLPKVITGEVSVREAERQAAQRTILTAPAQSPSPLSKSPGSTAKVYASPRQGLELLDQAVNRVDDLATAVAAILPRTEIPVPAETADRWDYTLSAALRILKQFKRHIATQKEAAA